MGKNMNLKDIIDGMLDWVRVIDTENNIIYVNRAMKEAMAVDSTGRKCYDLLASNIPCENCISRKAVFTGKSFEKEERIGDRIFSIRSAPVKADSGEITAAVEVLRDITEMKDMQSRIEKQNEKLKKDLDLARKLQCSLLPKRMLSDKVDFSFVYKPCDIIGGDFIDIFEIDSTHVGLYIADVSGHGVAASMLTVFLSSSFNKSTLSPSEALTELYGSFNRNDFNTDIYITVFYSIIDIRTGEIKYANAGHHALPVLFSKDRYLSLYAYGTPVSDWVTLPDYREHSITLEESESLLYFTDGLLEIKDPAGNAFGDTGLRHALSMQSGSSIEIVESLIDEAMRFSGMKSSADLRDDITVAVLKLKR